MEIELYRLMDKDVFLLVVLIHFVLTDDVDVGTILKYYLQPVNAFDN